MKFMHMVSMVGKKGFTLAETLITLTIIGVVAALTIPTLMSKYKDYVFKTNMKKAYSLLKNAVEMLPMDQNCSAGDLSCIPSEGSYMGRMCGKEFISALSKQFKVAKLCLEPETDNCRDYIHDWADKILAPVDFEPFFVTDAGMLVINENGSCGFYVDTNGIEGPNSPSWQGVKDVSDEFYVSDKTPVKIYSMSNYGDLLDIPIPDMSVEDEIR